MDFFEAQECARRNTVKLMLLFGLAIVLILVFTNLVLYYGLSLERALYAMDSNGIREPGWGMEAVFWINLVVLLLILGGTVYKIGALSSGGDAVASMLDGEPIFSDDPQPERKQLLNIVEEMAIASGVPVPQVYVLPEQGINAFAAGFEQSDTVIGVTAGALHSLNREQLQGVIAHEFSHILSGDMRLNVRLAGVLHGIMLLGLVGRSLCYSQDTDDYGQRKSSFSLSLAGIGLIVIGYAGYLCGRMIKAAICRQREYLADAAAVQFTRNPQGIGGALLQIGATHQGGMLRHHKSEQMSHAFFSNVLPLGFFSRILAAHPPLDRRIRRILPDWNGAFPIAGATGATGGYEARSAAQRRGLSSSFSLEGAETTAANLVDAAGSVSEAHVATARILNNSFPAVLRKASQDPFAARALIFFLLLDEQAEVRGNHCRASALMQGLADGYFVLPYTIGNYLATVAPVPTDANDAAFDASVNMVKEQTEKLMKNTRSGKGKETVDHYHRELGKVMWDNCGMARNAAGLKEAIKKIPEIRAEFWENVTVPGSGQELNQSLERAGRVADFLEFAELLAKDALAREESCGGHFREESQTEEHEAKRDDENFSHVAVWEYKGEEAEPVMHKEPLAFENVTPSQRSYK